MKINYWDCPHHDYDVFWEEGMDDELRCYGCTHPKGTRVCLLENKYGDDTDNCPLLDTPTSTGESNDPSGKA